MRWFCFVLACGIAAAGQAEIDVEWLAENAKKEGITTLPSGLQYRVVKSGSGKTPRENAPTECHYRGWTVKEQIQHPDKPTEFDSSYKRGQPATFAPNQVIRGWTEAMQLMKEGDTWELYIPNGLAYGSRNQGQHIYAGAALIFQLEMIKVKGASK